MATGLVYVFIYLLAIVLANLSAARFGPSSTIINAFVFIGLDLTLRDKIHDLWQGKRLRVKMAGLITTGAVLSWVINRDAGIIAGASFVAFAAAAVVDTVVYQILASRPGWVRINGSNVLSSLVDSSLFPTIAFGGFLWAITAGQFAVKVIGGAVWSLILTRGGNRRNW